MARLSKEEIQQYVDTLIKTIEQNNVLHLSVPEVVRQLGVSRTVAQIIYYKVLDIVINNPDKYIVNKLGSFYMIAKRNTQTNINKNFLQGVVFTLSLLYRQDRNIAEQLINSIKGMGLSIDLKDIISDNELLLQILHNQYEQGKV